MATKAVRPTSFPGVEAEAREAVQEFCDAANRQDIDAIVQFYSPEAVLLPPDHPSCEGHEAIRRFLKSLLRAGFDRLEAQIDRIEDSGDLVCIVGHNFTGIRQEHGMYKTLRGKCLEVRRRQPNGELRLVFHCFNNNEPASSR